MSGKKFIHGVNKKKPRQYPPEIKQQAIELFFSCRQDFRTRMQGAAHVADLLGIGNAETVLRWARQAETDNGDRPGITTSKAEEIRRLKRENAYA